MIKKLCFFFLLFTMYVLPSTKEEVKERIDRILSQLPPTTRAAVLIFNPLTEDTIYSLNHTVSMIPASNTKLFTTAAALNLMGGDFSLSTKLMTNDNNIRDGVINGNLYIKGYGNSVFTEGDLADMAYELKNNGVTLITGSIIGDDTYFDNVYTRDDWITNEVANVKLPPISAIVIDRNVTATYKRRRRYISNIDNPPYYAAELLRSKLINLGVEVQLMPEAGSTPESAIIITEKKILLRDLVALINKHSDNFLAECLFKTIGAVASGVQGNAFYSTQSVLDFIEDNGVYADGTAVVDGSGISRFNQITTGAIAGLLEKMYFDLKNFEDYYNSFSIAGVDGTLRNRMSGANFRGKTGTLNGVSSLAGYLTTNRDEDLVISIIFEFSKGGAHLHKSSENDIVQALTDLDN